MTSARLAILPLMAAFSGVAAFGTFNSVSKPSSSNKKSLQLQAFDGFQSFDSSKDGQENREKEESKKYPLQDQKDGMMSDDATVLSSADYFALEAFSLGTMNSSIERCERLFHEHETKRRFVFGNDLLELRSKVTRLRAKVLKVQSKGLDNEVSNLRARIRRLLLKDAEFVYGEMLDLAAQARQRGKKKDVKFFEDEAASVRGCLPHFNIEGLWVGKYGNHGYEMINVTYVGDTLIAKKVTGDKNVPKDEVTFTADLSPSFHPGTNAGLAPIELSDTASKQWGTKALMRYPGKGQVAGEGYVNAKFVEGQLIMVGEEYFSFAWIPIGHQIFFGRPSAELTLKMLKQSEGRIVANGRKAFITGDVETMRKYAEKCLDATDELCWFDEERDEISDEGRSNHFQ